MSNLPLETILHTPGPWRSDNDAMFPEEWYADQPVTAAGKVLAAAITSPDAYGLATAKANARLIAAAPELLEALSELLNTIQRNLPMPDSKIVPGSPMAKAQAAIDKARGTL